MSILALTVELDEMAKATSTAAEEKPPEAVSPATKNVGDPKEPEPTTEVWMAIALGNTTQLNGS